MKKDSDNSPFSILHSPFAPEIPPGLARAVEWEIARWRPPFCGIDAADYRQEARLAWWQASQRYDKARDVALSTYAEGRVRGRIKDVRKHATHRGRCWFTPLRAARAPSTAPVAREVWLWRRVNRLPRRQRYVIIRLYWSGWTLAQIARHLQRHPSRVAQLHRRALRALRLQCVLDLLECG